MTVVKTKREIWDSLDKETQDFITALCKKATIQAIKNNKGEVWYEARMARRRNV